MGQKDPQGTGRGGQFKREQNNARKTFSSGTGPNLDRYGSLGHCIQSVIAAGAYISFGRTTDGGATLIRVLDGDTKLHTYCSSDSEVLEAMEVLENEYKRKDKPTPLFTPSPPLK